MHVSNTKNRIIDLHHLQLLQTKLVIHVKASGALEILHFNTLPACKRNICYVQICQNKRKNTDLIKFVVPVNLKQELLGLASARNISLSALLRLIVSDYIKVKR